VEGAPQVGPNGVDRNSQAPCDLLVRKTAGDLTQYLELPSRELFVFSTVSVNHRCNPSARMAQSPQSGQILDPERRGNTHIGVGPTVWIPAGYLVGRRLLRGTGSDDTPPPEGASRTQHPIGCSIPPVIMMLLMCS